MQLIDEVWVLFVMFEAPPVSHGWLYCPIALPVPHTPTSLQPQRHLQPSALLGRSHPNGYEATPFWLDLISAASDFAYLAILGGHLCIVVESAFQFSIHCWVLGVLNAFWILTPWQIWVANTGSRSTAAFSPYRLFPWVCRRFQLGVPHWSALIRTFEVMFFMMSFPCSPNPIPGVVLCQVLEWSF